MCSVEFAFRGRWQQTLALALARVKTACCVHPTALADESPFASRGE